MIAKDIKHSIFIGHLYSIFICCDLIHMYSAFRLYVYHIASFQIFLGSLHLHVYWHLIFESFIESGCEFLTSLSLHMTMQKPSDVIQGGLSLLLRS